MLVHTHAGPLPSAIVAQVRGLATAAQDADGVAPLGEQTLLDLVDAAAPVRHLTVPDAGLVAGLVADPGADTDPASEVVGYACLDLRDRPTAELVVAPAARRRGLGRALLGAVRATALEEAGELPLVWAHGDLPAARALAADAGMTVQRELWQMSRPLDPSDLPPVPPAPPGVAIREFVPGSDDEAWLAVNARAFAHHPEQGRMAAVDLAARQAERWFRADDLLLAERDGRLLAFVWLKVEPGDEVGELYVLGVDPTAQGLGLGRLLTAMTLHQLAARGLRAALLYTEADNTAAVRTYTAAGFVRSRGDVQYG
jgi:mycothiol synthase